MIEKLKGCFLGLAVGDALGVPVEFRSREYLGDKPVQEMIGYGAWNQPPGTWSDDSSLTFCLAESLVASYDLHDIASKFVRWYKEGYWGAHYKLFDIGGTTRLALARVAAGEDPMFSGEYGEDSNGNGSLMRIAPAALYFSNLPIENFYQRIKEVSTVTHAHFRSVFSCFIFSMYLKELFAGEEKFQALANACQAVTEFATTHDFNKDELKLFKRILNQDIAKADEGTINSFGYVLDTLESSIWCFLNTDSFSEAVLKGVNLGGDTDTTGCVTGALAGLYYGYPSIPSRWTEILARKNDIMKLSEDFIESLKKQILHGKS
jgi:ADP-ribosyl-[dinitrogen reductase] hydrolase